ncbi:histone acetyltransferase subunit NuA4-domain-containing protein [Rhodocollybia butyracea]|uniref:Chromatin modification-related protein EAF6 n=1 Tax=Rhodocollybia butyracea TaxID=206335 RepID=A0A9P5U5M4_9AGAR|nr:histone acetyltransferase subunit NuA4-domain-containing protein [Rhodocollybia butyracea]
MTEDAKTRYEAIKKELLAAIPKKRAIDKKLAQVEAQIFTLEGSYLSETTAHSGGNLIQGFENYLKNQTVGRRRAEAAEHDRIFSNSSLTYPRSLDLMAEENGDDEYSKQSTPGLTTVIVPPATRNDGLTTAQQNKLTRDKEYQRRKRASTRRSAGTISDDDVAPSLGRRPTKRARLAEDD